MSVDSASVVMPRVPHSIMRVLLLLAFVLLWQVVAMQLASSTLPTPLQVLSNAHGHLMYGSLLADLGITLLRVTASFLIAMAFGTCIGILMGSYRIWDSVLDGMLILGLNIPALVTIILCYIWFGLSEVAAIVAVVVNKIPTVIVTVREGARAVDRRLMEVADVYRLSRWDTLSKVFFPQLYPYFVAAARNGLALIWKIVLVVELLGRSNGVGFELGTFFQFFDIQSILSYTLAFALVVLAVEAFLMRPLERRFTRWRS
jgi:ABC-type nitrate/sulfonate/bicarbonate transport system permease component